MIYWLCMDCSPGVNLCTLSPHQHHSNLFINNHIYFITQIPTQSVSLECQFGSNSNMWAEWNAVKLIQQCPLFRGLSRHDELRDSKYSTLTVKGLEGAACLLGEARVFVLYLSHPSSLYSLIGTTSLIGFGNHGDGCSVWELTSWKRHLQQRRWCWVRWPCFCSDWDVSATWKNWSRCDWQGRFALLPKKT